VKCHTAACCQVWRVVTMQGQHLTIKVWPLTSKGLPLTQLGQPFWSQPAI
jgi:hypothetical protein